MTLEQERKFNAYMEKYGSKYPPHIFNYIMQHYNEAFENGKNTDAFGQIFTKLGFLEENKNVYKWYLDILSKHFPLNEYFTADKNILEIGCGYWPIFTEYLAEEQRKIGRGSITAFDQLLILDELPGVNLHRRNFEESDDASPYSLFIGISPCKGSKLLINKSHENNGEFFLALCQCYYQEGSKFISETNVLTEEAYELYELALKTKPTDNEIIVYSNISCDNSYPVIMSKKNKRII